MIIDKIGGLAFSKLSIFLETNQLICDNTHQIHDIWCVLHPGSNCSHYGRFWNDVSLRGGLLLWLTDRHFNLSFFILDFSLFVFYPLFSPCIMYCHFLYIVYHLSLAFCCFQLALAFHLLHIECPGLHFIVKNEYYKKDRINKVGLGVIRLTYCIPNDSTLFVIQN